VEVEESFLVTGLPRERKIIKVKFGTGTLSKKKD
jgi:hypothetical protein